MKEIGNTNISISNKLHTIIVYYGLLIDMSKYYSKKHFNKNFISNKFKNIANKFMQELNAFYKKINNNKDTNFTETQKKQLAEISELLNNKCDFLK